MRGRRRNDVNRSNPTLLKPHAMRVVDAQEAIVVDEELTGLQELVHVLPTVQHLNVVVRLFSYQHCIKAPCANNFRSCCPAVQQPH